MRFVALSAISLICLCFPLIVSAERLSVAVAANFLTTVQQLKPAFEAASGHQLEISWGSTGKLYLQITQGAPYQLFLAADSDRPQRLEASGHGVKNSRFTYAVGCLALYSRHHQGLADQGQAWLQAPGDGYLALANPDLAPYGIAARQTLKALDLEQAYQDRLVFGENVSQAFRYVVSGAAEAGLVARSQAQIAVAQWGGSYWPVPDAFYRPIQQQAVLLPDGKESAAAAVFMRWLKGPDAQAIILAQGYSMDGCG